MTRRLFSALAIAALAVGASALATGLASRAHAQDKWPSKPVTVIVPFAAGGNTDVMARIFAEHLGRRLGQQFVVENKAGAGGVTGLNQVVKAAPDGYTIAVGTSGGLAINPVLIKDKMPYNAEKDFTYLYLMAATPNVWIVNNDVPAKTMPELIAWLKANPDTPYATSGIGTTQHICGEALALQAGLKMAPVAYRASNQSLQDLIGGQIKIACDNYPAASEFIKAGKIRAISMTSLAPFALAPEIEITAKTLPGFEIMPTFGWVAPPNLPADITKRLLDELTAVGKLPEVRTAMEKFGVVMPELSGQAYADAMKKERAGYAVTIEKAGIKVP
jgi:tripartite-type tricarboxylate transporter receptor subunit TctC